MARLCTIGVYGYTPGEFVDSLHRAGVALLIDVRQRRGVRGPIYPWANSLRLQRLVADAGIGYVHRRDLAPTTELRRLQYAEDAREGVGKRSRVQLAPAYVRGYTEQILDRADLNSLAREVDRAAIATLLCVERDPEACHRSLIAQRMAELHAVEVEHLRPRPDPLSPRPDGSDTAPEET